MMWKILTLPVTLAAFQGDKYRGVSRLESTLSVGIGNDLSYFVVYTANQKPWEIH